MDPESKINGITVRVSDGIKTADYAPPKLYDLTAICEGDADLDAVIDRLRKAGDRFLGRNVTEVSKTEPRATAEPTVLHHEEKPEDPQPETVSATPKPRKPRTVSSEPTEPAESVASGEPENDPLAGTEPPADGPVKVADEELNQAVAKKRGLLGEGSVPAIRALVESFNPKPGQPFVIRGIPQASRVSFLNKLADLRAV